MDKSLDKLAQLLQATETQVDFDIVGDLESLERLYGVLKSRDYRKKLQAVVEKYKQHELTAVRAVLLEKCRAGDVQAIRLYDERFRTAAEVQEDDGLIVALTKRAGEVFKDGKI